MNLPPHTREGILKLQGALRDPSEASGIIKQLALENGCNMEEADRVANLFVERILEITR